MTRRHQHHARVIKRFVRIPEELEDGKVRCAACSKVTTITKNGHLRQHRTPAGEPCAHRATYAPKVKLAELPEVNLRPAPKVSEERRPPIQRPTEEPSRLETGSGCDDCGKWLPGERHVCGQCSNKRDMARRKAQNQKRREARRKGA